MWRCTGINFHVDVYGGKLSCRIALGETFMRMCMGVNFHARVYRNKLSCRTSVI